MCGIAGFCDFGKKVGQEDVWRMIDAVRHRGPDSGGSEFYALNNVHVGLGHRRLSIIDLSEIAAQPLQDERGDYVITFNGEIYNYKEIRAELVRDGQRFFSSSDTEVLLKAFMRWGVDAVHRLIGMFAFVIYAKKEEKLYMVRDRAGVKPLHYYYKDGLFLFASELKSFYQLPAFKKTIDTEALPLFFRFGYVPTPLTIFENTYKLKPGHILTLDLKTADLSERKYWDVCDYYNMPVLNITERDAEEEMLAILKSALMYRMVSDVPVGVFLSSGYDSVAVTSILQSSMAEKLKTFTIGFRDEKYNEAVQAKSIAQYLGTDHTELYCTEQDVEKIMETLPYYYDEPFIDTSAIPTILVSRMAREKVTVALSADGGDEIFAGYDHFVSCIDRLSKVKHTPAWMKCVRNQPLDYFSRVTKLYGGYNRNILILINQIWKMRSRYAGNEIMNILVRGKVSEYRIYRLLNASPDITKTFFTNLISLHDSVDDINKCLASDYQNNMMDDMLTKVDRATMSVSLEGREPLLDHRIVEYAARLPPAYKYGNGIRKKILKQIVHRFVPEDMMNRQKKGFAVPVKKWLRGDLRKLFIYYLDEKRLNEHGLFNVTYASYLKERYLKYGTDYHAVLPLLVFQMWYHKWMNGQETEVN